MHGSAHSFSTVAPHSSPPLRREEAILHAAESRLKNSQYAALKHVWCEFHDGVLILRGRLCSHYLKQIAQSLVQDLEGVEEVANYIEVEPRTARNRLYQPSFVSG